MNTLVPNLRLSIIIPAVSRTVLTLIRANVTLKHFSTIRSHFSSRLVTSNFSVVLTVSRRFFLLTALGDVDLHFSLNLVTNANAVERGTTSAAGLYHQRNQSTCVTDGMTVT